MLRHLRSMVEVGGGPPGAGAERRGLEEVVEATIDALEEEVQGAELFPARRLSDDHSWQEPRVTVREF